MNKNRNNRGISTTKMLLGESDDEHGKKRNSPNYLGGVLALAVCLASWEAMGELVQDIQEGYKKPSFICYMLHNGYLLHLFISFPLIQIFFYLDGQKLIPIKLVDFRDAVVLNIMLYCSDYLWYLSLPRTLVAANNAMYQSMSVFVYLFSVLLLGEKIDKWKNIGLVFCLAGMVIIILNQGTSGSHGDVVGYLLCLGAVVVFAIYEVFFKMIRGHGTICETIYLTALMGVGNLLTCWIPVIVLHYTDMEVFKMPGDDEMYKMGINMCLGATYTASFLVGVALTSPLFMSLGCVFIVPIGVVTEKILNNVDMEWLFFLGTALVIGGFLFTLIPVFQGLNSEENLQQNEDDDLNSKRSSVNDGGIDYQNVEEPVHEGPSYRYSDAPEVEPSAPPML